MLSFRITRSIGCAMARNPKGTSYFENHPQSDEALLSDLAAFPFTPRIREQSCTPLQGQNFKGVTQMAAKSPHCLSKMSNNPHTAVSDVTLDSVFHGGSTTRRNAVPHFLKCTPRVSQSLVFEKKSICLAYGCLLISSDFEQNRGIHGLRIRPRTSRLEPILRFHLRKSAIAPDSRKT